MTAGLTLGLVSVPDGLAMGLLAGLNPVAGLYGYLVGTMAGAFATSSVLMSVQATGAMAELISDIQALGRYHDELRAAGGHLLLAGVEPQALRQLSSTQMLYRLGTENVFAARPTLGDAMHQAIERAGALRGADE